MKAELSNESGKKELNFPVLLENDGTVILATKYSDDDKDSVAGFIVAANESDGYYIGESVDDWCVDEEDKVYDGIVRLSN